MKGRRKADLQTLDLFAAPTDGDSMALSTTDWLAALERLADAGLLRRLDSALAAFVAAQDAEAGPALLVATAVLAQMEGRGHSCLPLKALAGDPNQILAWPKEAERLQQSLWEPLPGRLADWLQALRRSPVVRVVQPGAVVADRGQPLVLLDGAAPLLYLRRYWDYERAVATHVIQRTAAGRSSVNACRQGYTITLTASKNAPSATRSRKSSSTQPPDNDPIHCPAAFTASNEPGARGAEP